MAKQMDSAAIEIAQYDVRWPAMFDEEKSKLQAIAGEYLTGSIEHIGSTSVNGLMAKPVIDIMFGVSSLEASVSAIEKIKQYGYCHSPYKQEVMHWFCKPSEHVRTHHLHLVPFESTLWHQRIKFRDILRQNPDVANSYQTLKLQLAVQSQHDRENYTKQKWPFIQQILSDYDNK